MAENINAVILKFPGTNNDSETLRALLTAGFKADIIPVTQISRERIFNAALVVIPGGFSYGDYVRAGKLATLELQLRLGATLEAYHERGGLLLGICNGFQILLQLGLLPAGSLTQNTSQRFICRWVKLNVNDRRSPFLTDLPAAIELPVAHAEGRFIAADDSGPGLLDAGLVGLQYGEPVNGSQLDIAGISNATGRVFGLMPHPERFLFREDHYASYRHTDDRWGYGYYFFKAAFNFITGGTRGNHG